MGGVGDEDAGVAGTAGSLSVRNYRMNKTNRLFVLALSLGVIILVAILVGGYALGWQWTGMGEFQISVPSDRVYQRQKTLWDWLDLLIVPAALAGGALWLNRSQQRREREIATDERFERALQNYYDRISSLLINHDLRDPSNDQTSGAVAQALTLSTLNSIDKNRRVLLVRFLHNAALIHADEPIISLTDTDFTDASFWRLYLRDAKLSYVDFARSNFRGAMLYGSNLSGSNFECANLGRAILYDAKLIGTNMSSAELSESDLGAADATGADFSGASLVNANFSGAKLISVNFAGANLSGANLSNTDLTGADLKGAILSGASFNEAYMFGVDLRNADKTKADFSGATILSQVE